MRTGSLNRMESLGHGGSIQQNVELTLIEGDRVSGPAYGLVSDQPHHLDNIVLDLAHEVVDMSIEFAGNIQAGVGRNHLPTFHGRHFGEPIALDILAGLLVRNDQIAVGVMPLRRDLAEGLTAIALMHLSCVTPMTKTNSAPPRSCAASGGGGGRGR